MTEWSLIVGPPGTGKTTSLLEVLRQEVARGVPPSRIAFLSFTRAARLEALSRVTAELGLNEDDLPWLRTIHSSAYRLLRLRPEGIMLDARWKEFATSHGYELTDIFGVEEERPLELPRRTEHDQLRWVLSWGRCCRYAVDEAHARCRTQVHGVQLRRFADRFARFKEEHGLLDFSDMVERVIELGLGPQVDVVIIDEAQDLSPLEIAAIEIWTSGAERVYVGGDPNQAIYNFKAAAPDWMLRLRETASVTYLDQSRRVPRAAHQLATDVIRRNRHRLDAAYRPVDRDGVVERLDMSAALEGIGDRGAFVLARNRFHLRTAATKLFEAARPYVVEGGRAGKNPLGAARLVRAVRTALSIHKGVTRIDHADVAALLSWVPVGSGLVSATARPMVKNMRGTLDVEAVAISAGFAPLMKALRVHPTRPLEGLTKDYRTYFQKLIDRHGEVPAPTIRLMTMHGSKGREHDHVVLLSDHTTAVDTDCRRGDPEAENRIRYVAVTRTRDRLTICRPEGSKFYQYPRTA